MFSSKKGASIWVSWVILIGFVVALSGLLLGWMQGFGEDTMTGTKKRLVDTETCESISISVDSYVCPNPELLNMLVTNRNYFRVNQIIVRIYYDDKSIGVVTINKTIKPDAEFEFSCSRKNSTISSIEVIPAYDDGTSVHVCETKRLLLSSVSGTRGC